jgi:hypothetical protein
MELVTVVCVLRKGGWANYDSSWVEKLQNMVSRNLTIPHKFVCLSDCDVPCERIPLEPTNPKHKGWWAKLQLFKPDLFRGPTLYLDLDTVIVGNIDDIVKKVYDQNFVMWFEKDKKIHSSAMMWWNGDMSHLWHTYKSQPDKYWNQKYAEPPIYGDQGFIEEHQEHKLFTDLLPNEWFHIVTKLDRKYDLSNVKILHFRKASNKPHLYTDHPLISKHWC